MLDGISLQSKIVFHIKYAKALQIIGFIVIQVHARLWKRGSVKGRAESTLGLITDTAGQQQNPEPQVRNETDEDESVDSFDYFARPQSQDIYTFFSYHPQQTPNIAIPKVFKSKDGTNRKWPTYSTVKKKQKKKHSLYCSVCLAFAPLVSVFTLL